MIIINNKKYNMTVPKNGLVILTPADGFDVSKAVCPRVNKSDYLLIPQGLRFIKRRRRTWDEVKDGRADVFFYYALGVLCDTGEVVVLLRVWGIDYTLRFVVITLDEFNATDEDGNRVYYTTESDVFGTDLGYKVPRGLKYNIKQYISHSTLISGEPIK